VREAHQYDSRMNRQAAAIANFNVHKIQQVVKWTVYTLLIINFVFYILEDWSKAVHTLDAGSNFLDWTGEFAAIEMNVSEWRDELLGDRESA